MEMIGVRIIPLNFREILMNVNQKLERYSISLMKIITYFELNKLSGSKCYHLEINTKKILTIKLTFFTPPGVYKGELK